MECWIIGLIVSIYCIAFLDNQMVNPVSSITLPFQALHKFQKSVLQFIRLGIQTLKLFFGSCFFSLNHYSTTPTLHRSITTTPTLQHSIPSLLTPAFVLYSIAPSPLPHYSISSPFTSLKISPSRPI